MPRAVSVAATSELMNDPPIHTTCSACGGVGGDRVRGRDRPQVVDPVQVAVLGVDPAHVRARREQRLVERDLVAVRQLRPPRVGVELHHARAREQLDLLLAPPLVRAEQDVVARLLAAEVLLRQRRPVVGRVVLAPDEQDRSAVGTALLANPARAVRARQPTADDQIVDRALGHGSATRPRPAPATGSAPRRDPRARCRARAAPRRRPRSASRRAARSPSPRA